MVLSVNFTREPIIETVIIPREGCKLVIRSSKGNGQEDFFVDAIEVVSFGNSIFYRSTERPKSFLLPVSDYEVIELKETRMVLKNISSERSIKIGGGREREATPRAPKEEVPQEMAEQGTNQQEKAAPQQEQHGSDRKRDKRRSRRRRGMEQKDEMPQKQPPAENAAPKTEGAPEETPMSSSVISRLFPPPPTLIKEKLGKYKDAGVLEANLLSDSEKAPTPESLPGDLLEFGKEEVIIESTKDEILPEDLEPNEKGPLDEPIFNPEVYEENHPKINPEEEISENPKGD